MATKSTRIAVLFYLLLAFIVDCEAKDFDVRTYGARPNGDIGQVGDFGGVMAWQVTFYDTN